MKIIIFLILLFPNIICAQKQTNIWYFGEKAGLDFNNGQAVALTNSAMKQLEGCATISDSLGKLLFYTNGITIWNASHYEMPNGKSLLGNNSSAQVLIIKKPKSKSRYYIFYADIEGGPKGLRYSEVDMDLNNGLGDVILDNKNILLHKKASERITAVNHCNNNSIWLMSTNLASKQFYAYLITEDGILPPVKSLIKTDHGFCCSLSKFSPNGKWLINTNNAANHTNEDAELYTFNNKTGIAEFYCAIPKNKNTGESFYGASFSPDNTKLYLSTIYNADIDGAFNALLQYDLESDSIPNSRKLIYKQLFPGSGVNANPFGALQNASNGKIYLARWGTNSGNASGTAMDTLGIIHLPNLLGVDCKFDPAGISLKGRNSLLGLPGFNESFFNPVQSSNEEVEASFKIKKDLEQNTYTFINTSKGEYYYWDFGDGNNSTDISPKHTYSKPGKYAVKLYVNYNDCITDSFKNELVIEWDDNIKDIDSIISIDTTESGIDTLITDTLIKEPVITDTLCYIYIANALSPNNDNINDLWKPVICDTKTYRLSVYNRWGEMIFYTEDKNLLWDGKFKGSKVMEGIYFYKLEAETFDNSNIHKYGFLTVIY